VSSRILVTAANGKVGRAVVRQLQEMGRPVRAAVRDPEKTADLGGPDTEIVSFDFDQPELVGKAVDGISAMCLITPPHFKQVEWATETIDRALEAGVGRIVRLSVRVADLTPSTKMTRWHRAAERYLKASDCQWTVVRPTPFMQNFMGLAPRSQEGYFFPLSEDARACHMDIRDAALVLAKALTESGHDGKTYTITGGESLPFHGMCSVLSQKAGRDFPCNYVSEAEAREVMLSGGVPDWLAELVLELFAIIRTGAVAEPLDGYEQLTGSKPTPLERFAENNKNALPHFAGS
jgi:uncharacterized protein YbjT (DUF2867 family)